MFRDQYFNTFAGIVYDSYHSVFSSIGKKSIRDGSDAYDEEADQLIFCADGFSLGGMALSSNVLIDPEFLFMTVFLPYKMSMAEKERLHRQCKGGALGPIWNFDLDPNSELEDSILLSYRFDYSDKAVAVQKIKSALQALAETVAKINSLTGR